MATVSTILSEDEPSCCICLDGLTDPVTIPCGHTFCKKCLTQYWNCDVKQACPLCKELFSISLETQGNTFQEHASSLDQEGPNAGEILCDVCTQSKAKALKSCLVCLSSYCETHLGPHLKMTGLRRHRLVSPVENLEYRMWKMYENSNRQLEMFKRWF